MLMSFRIMAVGASFDGLPFSMRVCITFHIWIEPGGDNDGYIDGLLGECPAATNVAFSFERAAVLGDRGDAHQNGVFPWLNFLPF